MEPSQTLIWVSDTTTVQDLATRAHRLGAGRSCNEVSGTQPRWMGFWNCSAKIHPCFVRESSQASTNSPSCIMRRFSPCKSHDHDCPHRIKRFRIEARVVEGHASGRGSTGFASEAARALSGEAARLDAQVVAVVEGAMSLRKPRRAAVSLCTVMASSSAAAAARRLLRRALRR